jgi:serine/threonine-protein kinase RsbW
MKTTITKEGNLTNVLLEGRLDTTTAEIFQKEIQQLFEGENPNIVLDCKDLEYISSSGLRVILSLQKSVMSRKGGLVLRALKPTILSIFVMTGLSNVLTIEK